MGFQKTILIIALVILSISIIVLGSFISKKDKEKMWPPESSTCPPYYDLSYNNLGEIHCNGDNFGFDSSVDISGVGNHHANCASFMVQDGSGVKMNSDQKCQFVETCKVNWEGWCEKPSYSY